MNTIVKCFSGKLIHEECCEVAEHNPDFYIPNLKDIDRQDWLQEFLGYHLRHSEGHNVKITLKIDIL